MQIACGAASTTVLKRSCVIVEEVGAEPTRADMYVYAYAYTSAMCTCMHIHIRRLVPICVLRPTPLLGSKCARSVNPRKKPLDGTKPLV